jgi:hypothetical protein
MVSPVLILHTPTYIDSFKPHAYKWFAIWFLGQPI